MQSYRSLLLVPVTCVAGIIGCHDPFSAPAAARPNQDSPPHQDVVYNRYLTTNEFLALGGQLLPTVRDSANPNAQFVQDNNGRYALKASASVTFQFVNEMEATLSAVIKNSTSGTELFSQEQPFNQSLFVPVIVPRLVSLGFTISAGTNRCGILGRANLTATGTLKLLNSNWLPVTLYSLPLSKQSPEPILPDCEQRRTTEEPSDEQCDDQTAFAPGDCGGGGTAPPGGGAGGGCGLWVRRVWVTYNGGLTWTLESESFFTRC